MKHLIWEIVVGVGGGGGGGGGEANKSLKEWCHVIATHSIAYTHGLRHTYPILMFNHFLYDYVLILDVNNGGHCLHFRSYQYGAKHNTKVAGLHQIHMRQLSDSLVEIR